MLQSVIATRERLPSVWCVELDPSMPYNTHTRLVSSLCILSCGSGYIAVNTYLASTAYQRRWLLAPSCAALYPPLNLHGILLSRRQPTRTRSSRSSCLDRAKCRLRCHKKAQIDLCAKIQTPVGKIHGHCLGSQLSLFVSPFKWPFCGGS